MLRSEIPPWRRSPLLQLTSSSRRSENVGTDLASGMAESPGWNVFALEGGLVYHTYSRTAPDRFLLAPYYHQLLDQIPDGRDADFPLRRHDEY